MGNAILAVVKEYVQFEDYPPQQQSKIVKKPVHFAIPMVDHDPPCAHQCPFVSPPRFKRSMAGEEQVLAVKKAGEYFGEIALVLRGVVLCGQSRCQSKADKGRGRQCATVMVVGGLSLADGCGRGCGCGTPSWR